LKPEELRKLIQGHSAAVTLALGRDLTDSTPVMLWIIAIETVMLLQVGVNPRQSGQEHGFLHVLNVLQIDDKGRHPLTQDEIKLSKYF